jgi:Amt family ammonium transporter
VSSLRGRIPAWATALLGFLVGALLYPLVGNWTWGGGWLANLGGNLSLGHSLVDPGGAGQVHLLGAAVSLAGLLVFLPRRPRRSVDKSPVALPAATFPLLGLLGVGSLFIGLAAWLTANPLLPKDIELQRVLLHTVLAAASAALFSLGYTGLVAGRYDPLMATRAVGAAAVAGLAAAAFIPAWAALVLGALIGALTPIAIFTVDRILRWDDPTAGLTIHGLGGLLGLVAVGLLADGTAGVGAGPDFPAQLQAQLTGAAAIGLFGFFVAWLVLAPPAIALHLLAARETESPAQPVEAVTGADLIPPIPQSPAPHTPAPSVADHS